MLIKSAPVEVLAPADDAPEGTFEAIVSVFGNVDLYGDRVMPGAFAKSLAQWTIKGLPIPVLWSHRSDDPDYNIGAVLEAKETDQGLYVKGLIDLDAPKGKQVHRLLQQGRVAEFSFAYDLLDYEVVDEDGREVWNLKELDLHEVGPCQRGANPATELLAVKAAGAEARRLASGIKAGRVLSAKNEDELRSAHDAIGRVLAALEPGDDGKSRATGAAQSASLLIKMAVTEADHELLTEGARS